jgi:hypothetical protein
MHQNFPKLLSSLFCLAFISIGLAAYSANDSIYEARRASYIATALANFDGDAITIQAYEGLPVDSATLAGDLSGIATGETSDFTIEQLVRVLYFTHGAYDAQILPVLNAVPYWVNYGDTVRCYWSENHMLQWMSSDWLLHERYGKPIDATLRNRLVHYLNLKLQSGYYEFFSSVYNPYCLAGLLNLADFAQDTVIKNLSIQASQLLMKDFMMLTNDQGVFYPTAGRNYYDKYETPYGQNHNNIIWLLTGFGQAPGNASHGGGFLATSTVPVDTVIQSWVPVLNTTYIVGQSVNSGYALNAAQDSLDRIVFQWSAGEYFPPFYAAESYTLITDSNLWHNSVFSAFLPLSALPVADIPQIAENLSSASYSSVICSDTLAIFKHNSITLSSLEDFWPGKWGYQQYPCVADVETTAVYTASGQVLPWASRSSDNANDDLPYVKQSKNVSLLMYRPEPKSAILGKSDSTVSLHWLSNNFTEVRNDSLWLLGRVDNNYVGVRRASLNMVDSFWATGVPRGQSWVIIVGDSIMYGSFNNFQAVIDSSQFTEQWYYDSLTQQSVYYAQIIIDSQNISHAWGIDSALSTGIKNIQPDNMALSVYPNPANTAITVTDDNIATGKIEIYNAIGDLVYQAAMNDKAVSVVTAQWSEGLYAVRISSGAGTVSKCFVVSH